MLNPVTMPVPVGNVLQPTYNLVAVWLIILSWYSTLWDNGYLPHLGIQLCLSSARLPWSCILQLYLSSHTWPPAWCATGSQLLFIFWLATHFFLDLEIVLVHPAASSSLRHIQVLSSQAQLYVFLTCSHKPIVCACGYNFGLFICLLLYCKFFRGKRCASIWRH